MHVIKKICICYNDLKRAITFLILHQIHIFVHYVYKLAFYKIIYILKEKKKEKKIKKIERKI